MTPQQEAEYRDALARMRASLPLQTRPAEPPKRKPAKRKPLEWSLPDGFELMSVPLPRDSAFVALVLSELRDAKRRARATLREPAPIVPAGPLSGAARQVRRRINRRERLGMAA